jgi:hypothetical protein
MEVRHWFCGVKLCLNPDHLKWGTRAENEADKMIHGTSNQGEGNGRAKLTVVQVAEIRRRYAAGGITQAALGREYGVAGVTIHDVVRGRNWPTHERRSP